MVSRGIYSCVNIYEMIFRVKFSMGSGVDTHTHTHTYTYTFTYTNPLTHKHSLQVLSIIGKKRLAEASESSTRSSDAGESSTSATYQSKKPSELLTLYSTFA